MAIRVMSRARTAVAAMALLAAGVVTPAVASATPDSTPQDKPTIAEVQQKLGRLAMQNSQIVEKFNHARVQVQKRDKAADAAAAAARKAERTYRNARVEFARNVQAQYQSGSLGAAGALFDSQSGPNYLDRLSTLDLISTYDADIVSRLEHARSNARDKSEDAEQALAVATRERNQLGAKRRAVTKQIATYRDLLSTLSAQQRAQYERAANPSVSDKRVRTVKDRPIAASASAKRAVEFALDQVGKPYVFGASGPGAYDCSGLTMASWQAGGVGLPHSAADQFNYGTHVSLSSLSPGDLIFMYQPIGHVTIYIGDGMMVSAPTEGEPVQVVPVDSFSGDIVGATHLA